MVQYIVRNCLLITRTFLDIIEIGSFPEWPQASHCQYMRVDSYYHVLNNM